MIRQRYAKEKRNQAAFLIFLSIALFCTAGLCITIKVNQNWYELPQIMYRHVQGYSTTSIEKIIVLMRIPRVLMALIAGVGLSTTGAVMQSITRSYLVSPFTLGVSAAAAFGASLCIVFGNSFMQSDIGIITGAFFFTCVCVAFVYSISIYNDMSSSALILIGIAMNYFFSAMTSMITFFAAEYKLAEIIHWSFGTLNKATWNSVFIAFIITLGATIIYHRHSLELDALAHNDDETALSLGVTPQRLRFLMGVLSALVTATIISFTGIIGFVGLIGPHIARLLIGTEHRFFLPLSGLCGAWLLLISDTAGKYILYPITVPAGIVVACLGVPLFVHLIIMTRKKKVQ